MANSFSSPFAMHGARDAIAGGLAHIDQQVKSIESAVIENPGLAFDLAKTLVESVCRAILTERSIAFGEDDDLPKLFRIATQSLSFMPSEASAETETRKSLAQTLGGLHAAMQGICELRNQCGFASHGSGSPRAAMESIQAMLAAEAADTIVGFLYRIHRRDRMPPSNRQTEYEANWDFNEYVDDTHGLFRIFKSEFRPSEVLFQMEPETYRLALADFKLEAEGAEISSEMSQTASISSEEVKP